MNDAAFDLGAGMIITVFVCLLLDGLSAMVNERRARRREALQRRIEQAVADDKRIIVDSSNGPITITLPADCADKYHVRLLIEDAHSIPPPLPDLSGRTPDAWPL